MVMNLNQPLVSVIIPSYKRDTVLGAVKSVLDQTHKNIELLVVDDCSPKPVKDILSSIIDPRLRVIRQEKNSGVSAARNQGVKEARGDFIAFLDDDDKWLPRKLERQLEIMEKTGSDASVTQFFREAANKVTQEKGFKGSVPIWAKVSGMAVLIGSGMVIRKDKFLEVGPFNEKLPRAEDWDWLVRSRKMPLTFIDEPLLSYAGAHRASPDKEAACVRTMWQEHKNILKASDRSSYRALKMAMLLKEARGELFQKKHISAALKIGKAFIVAPVTFTRCAAYCIQRAAAPAVS